MRIDSHDTIAGYPAKTIRKLMGDLRHVTYVNVEHIAVALDIDKAETERLLYALVAQGFLEENPKRRPSKFLVNKPIISQS